MCEPKTAKRKYESLRANALGHINRADGFTLFLRNGMSVWLRSLKEWKAVHRVVHNDAAPVFTQLDAGIPEVGLIAILADAILKSARTADYRG